MGYFSLITLCGIILVIPAPCSTARILALMPLPLYSHQAFFYPLWQNLSQRGHEITLYTTHPMNNPALTNLTEVYLNVLDDNVSALDILKNASDTLSGQLQLFDRVFNYLPNTVLQQDSINQLITNQNKHFDLVIVESIMWSLYAFAKKFHAPLIVVSSLACSFYNYASVGNPEAQIADEQTLFEQDFTFLQRVSDVIQKWLANGVYHVGKEKTNTLLDKHFGKDYTNVEELFGKISMVFDNTNNVLYKIRPLLNNVVQISGLNLHANHPNISQDLQSILDKATNGFIYVSLGTVVGNNQIQSKLFLEAFKELPYTVLWKNEQVLDAPSNVYVSKWFPQFNVLKHKNIKLFITQCGTHSTLESIYNQVPMIGIPFFLDQHTNSEKIEKLGVGIKLDYRTLNKELFKDKILEAIEKLRYKANVIKLSNLIKDQPLSGLDNAVFWTEYVIRHNVILVPCWSARILAILPLPLYSHQSFFYPLWQNLSQRGHEITIFTTHPMNDPLLKNVTEVDISFLNNHINPTSILQNATDNLYGKLFYLDLAFYDIPNLIFEHGSIKQLLANQNEIFDLVIVESSVWSFYALAKKFQCPLIVVSSLTCILQSYISVGNPEAYLAPEDTLFEQDLTFLQRFLDVVGYWFANYFYYLGKQRTIAVLDKHFGKDYANVEEHLDRISMVFENTNNILYKIRPLLHNVVQIGGLNLYANHPNISQDLQHTLDNATNGFIYVSLGTTVQDNKISTKIFLETFKQLPYTVLWKNEKIVHPPSNVHVSKWFPQFNVLRHKNCKLFVMQSGSHSLIESIYNEIPVVGLPIYLDQFTNSEKIEKLGIGLQVDYKTLNAKLFRKKILEVSQNLSSKMEFKLDVDRLLRDELEYELQIRRIDYSGNVEKLRKTLRSALALEKSGNVFSQIIQLDAKTEITICEQN
ncbi:hypothetical protein RN001_015183 [Aquatica leii]|uniref:UDP-glycosyltransferases domain-containing protein n=1 Tax=Aquatica leii TaxID=1421715 RepID=A0AAN7PPB8_9COLE|nr:hypothetical protein RN001_015183 [Aquatica leii]